MSRRAFTTASLSLALLMAAACGSSTTEGEAVAKTDNDAPTLPAGFGDFYERFHADSAYQMAHVTWPLDGNVVTNAAGERRDERWEASDWRLHRPLELGDSYVRELEASEAAETVTERVKTREGQYILERRFAKLGGAWYLIWYRVAAVG